MRYFISMLVDYDSNNKGVSDDVQTGSLISQFYESNEYAFCSLLLFSTYKYIDDVTEPGLLADMAYFFGRLAFKDEFYNCLNKLSLLEFQWTGEAVHNVGAALCDNFFVYEQAIECFSEAIRIKPELWQPKQSIFVAGKYLILELCDKNKANEAYQLGVKIQSLAGNYTTDDHGFYSYLGLGQVMGMPVSILFVHP